MTYAVNPLSDRTWLRPASKRVSSRFDTPWPKVEAQLRTEVGYLRGRNLVIEIDVQPSDLKLNGELRARAKAASPAVIVAFDSQLIRNDRPLGAMLYRCDTYVAAYYGTEDWHHNVTAIVRTLESLRAVDRHGATDTGQQYAGFKQLGAGTAMGAAVSSHLTSSDAQKRVLALAGSTSWPTTEDGINRVVTLAKRTAHPDRNDGDHTEWRELAEALTVLRLDR